MRPPPFCRGSRRASYVWGWFGTGWAIEHCVGHHVGMPAVNLLRARTGLRGVTNIELFFDLVYAFAVTQLSHYLLDHATVEGVIQAAVPFGLVWTIWASTAYFANWLDPNRLPVRWILLAIMVVSLISSAALPEAFKAAGLAIGASYAAVQIGRNRFAVYAIILLLLLIPIAVFLPGLAVAALAIVGLGVVVAALRGQAPVAVLEAIRPATAGD
jgi:hypothetical protein